MAESSTIRIFVSSTFNDLKVERDALQREVFPRLNQLCLSNGLRFQAIDLRWGVSEEAGRDNRTMRICLRELRRCQLNRPKPNFLILLGDRYGWQPLPEIIPEHLFEQLSGYLISEDEAMATAFSASYRRDDNAVPPVFELQPRGVNVDWDEEIENPLLAALKQAAEALGLNLEKENTSIGTSATEQEIIQGALKVPDAAEHVRAFFRTVDGFPDPAPDDFVETGKAAKNLEQLKKRIRRHIGEENVCGYSVPWRGDGINPSDLSEFCEQAWQQLKVVVEQQIASLGKIQPDELEEQAHHEFAKERSGRFVGRSASLKRIVDYLHQESGKPLAVIGRSGSGKSALMAKAVKDIQKAEIQGQTPQIIARYIGATPASSDLIQLLRNMIGEVRRRYPVSDVNKPQSVEDALARYQSDEIPLEYAPLVASFHEALRRATSDRPLFIFLDALDQLVTSHNAHSLEWLPGSLNPHTRLVVSAALPAESGITASSEDSEVFDPCAEVIGALSSKMDSGQQVILAPLNVEDGNQMLTNWLTEARRTLQPEQRHAIVMAFQAEGSPLWLKTAAEEARRLRSWQSAPSFAPTNQGLLEQVLDRLSLEEEHGEKLVSRMLSYLASARYGLEEPEILDILSLDIDVMEDFRRRSARSPRVNRLPVAVWVRLYGDLAFYLTENQVHGISLINFYHRSVLEAVRARGPASSRARRTLHQHLAGYFVSCAKGNKPGHEWETNSIRGFSECIFHLVRSGQEDEAGTLLSNFSFLLHKTRVGLLEGVFEDYRIIRSYASPDVRKRLQIWSRFFREKAHILRRGNEEWPVYKILLQLAVEHADDSPLTMAAEQWLSEDRCDWLWMRRNIRLPSTKTDPCLATLEGNTSPIKGAEELANGRVLSWSWGASHIWDGQSGKPLAAFKGHFKSVFGALVMENGCILTWGEDGTLRVWDGQSGESLAILKGNAGPIYGARELADGRILSWALSGTLCIWNGKTGELISCLKGRSRSVKNIYSLLGDCTGALELSDGRILGWFDERTLRIWDGKSGEPAAVLKGHGRKIRGAGELSDGRIVAWADALPLRIWDGQSGELIATLRGHSSGWANVCVLNDGRFMSWAGDEILRIWTSQNEKPILTLRGHSGQIRGAQELSDGRILSWAGDRTLRIWDGQNGETSITMDGHSDSICGAIELADGRILSWSDDMTLRTWNGKSGEPVASFTGHSGSVIGAKELADGRILSWSDDRTLRIWNSQNTTAPATLEGRPRTSHHGPIASEVREPGKFQGRDMQVLSDGRILSWGKEGLQIWSRNSGEPIAILEADGIADEVEGARELPGGRILSWGQAGLRVWNGNSGMLIDTFGYPEHSLYSKSCAWNVTGALVLSNGCVLGWSSDGILRIWDIKRGVLIATLNGHTDGVTGALELPDRRLLSWSEDSTLRIWNSQSGQPVATLVGHEHKPGGMGSRGVFAAQVLSDGRVLSCADDGYVRIWNSQTGEPVAALLTPDLYGACELSDGQILSWGGSGKNFLWDGSNDRSLAEYSDDEIRRHHPPLLHARVTAETPDCAVLGFSLASYLFTNHRRRVQLRHKTVTDIVSVWQGNSFLDASLLDRDGSAVATQDDGQVCILHLYNGNQRIGLDKLDKELTQPRLQTTFRKPRSS